MTENTVITAQHLRIWDEISSLPDGERILGHQLRTICGIKTDREFYHLIEGLRENVYFIGSSRGAPRGYFEIRSDHEMNSYISGRKAEIEKEWDALNKFQHHWFRKVVRYYEGAEEDEDIYYEGAAIDGDPEADEEIAN